MIVACLAASCNLLDLTPKSYLTDDKYWKSESDIENGVTAMYYSLSKAMAKGYYDWGELRGGNYIGNQPNGPDQYDIINNIMTSNNGCCKWTDLYQAISRANLALKYIPGISVEASIKNGYMSECYAVRALCYFYLVRVWGDIPLFVKPVENYTPEEVFKERTDVSLVMEQIKSDLKQAEIYAQPVKNEKVDRSRVNVMTVYAIMADVYAWLHEYDNVISVMDKVYALAPKGDSKTYWKTLDVPVSASQESFTEAWQDIFTRVEDDSDLSKVSRERIFYIHYNEVENGLNGNTSYFGVGVCKATPSPRLLSVYESGDKRYSATYSSAGKLTAKFWKNITEFGSKGQVSDCDLVMYRMSDLVLLHAEALAATGNISGAVTELNTIRTRSGLKEYRPGDFLTPDEAVLAVLNERIVELIGEGKYWFDLRRTGHAADIGGVEDMNKLLFPINKTHLDENRKLKQNPGYGAGE